MTAVVIILAVLVALLFAGGAGLYRRVRELELATYNGVGVRFATTGPEARANALAVPGSTTMVIKVNRRCPICDDVLLAAADMAATLPSDLSFTVLSDDPGFDKSLPASVRVIRDPAIWRAASVPYAPALLVVDEHGVVVFTAPVGSGEALTEIVERAVANKKEVKL
ncbi:hypothetical protein ACFFV7_49490 [Nonomuraea spiralis]|uniref:Thioredoxin domain-containing protein n=1 Tax=Nonomuraea spiralis TaxID=46182 RepID=A0ABV5IXL2_9ACTN|nr:hypothetical protein [Nonomuraea spiralis]GGT12545.1 hypothetical protein GCM10010176_066640 [Nonomuraea spiralis]